MITSEPAQSTPWWKNPHLILPAVVAIIAAVIGTLTWGSNPDFNLSINSLQGTVQQGGVISPALTVTAEDNYRESVSFSASGLPSGTLISFNSSNAVPTPFFTSNANITVDPQTPPGSYELTINGLGADGKEHQVKYLLNVLPGVVSKPAAQPGAAEQTRYAITSPADGSPISANASYGVPVTGTYPATTSENLWIIVYPEKAPGIGWPQPADPELGTPAVKGVDTWSVPCNFGGPPQKYSLVLYTATPGASSALTQILQGWHNKDKYPGLSISQLPKGLTEVGRIHVEKK